MPAPKLTQEERRFGNAAALLAALLVAGALWMLFPEMAGGRPFSLLLAAALFGLAWGALQAARAPREKRKSLAPALWATFLGGALTFLFGGLPHLGSGLLLAVWLVSAFVYFRAAPGISPLATNLSAPAEDDDEKAPAPVKLGVRAASVKE